MSFVGGKGSYAFLLEKDGFFRDELKTAILKAVRGAADMSQFHAILQPAIKREQS